MSSNAVKPAATYSSVVGRVLNKLRDQKRFDQAKMAEAVGVTQPTWSKIENGRSSLTIDQLELAAATLKTRSDEILKMVSDSIQNLERKGVKIEQTKQLEKVASGFVLIRSSALDPFLVLTPPRPKN